MAKFSSPVSLEISVLESLMTPLSASSTGMFLDDVMVVSTRSWDTNAEDKDAGRAASQYLDTVRLLARILGGTWQQGWKADCEGTYLEDEKLGGLGEGEGQRQLLFRVVRHQRDLVAALATSEARQKIELQAGMALRNIILEAHLTLLFV
jgi:hypothetical protein